MKKPLCSMYLLLFIFISVHVHSMPAGKMIISGFKGTSPTDPKIVQLKQKIDAHHIGGIIVFKRNIKSKLQLQSLIQFLTKDTPIFVAIDHEGGLVNRLTHPSFNLKTPSPELFCKLPLIQQQGYANQISRTLKDIGINVNLGGVVDIAPLIYTSSICKYKRCFSDSQELITSCTSILFDSHKKQQIFFALKHFPGHGSTPVDSHYRLPDITQSHSAYDFMPYFKVMNQASNFDMIMVGHLMDKRIDETYPASLSKPHIQTLKKHLNYNGFIITDDLNMGALHNISKNKSKIATIAASAGNHLLLFEYLTFDDIDRISLAIEKASEKSASLTLHIVDSTQRINHALLLNDS